MKGYRVNEIYSSVQGEGHRAGTDNIFLRFSGCNLRCAMKKGPKSPGGFDCDTEFESGRTLTPSEVVDWIATEAERGDIKWVIATGGEPMLQLDSLLVSMLHAHGFKIAVETNGTRVVQSDIDYVCISPKVAEHCIVQRKADEVRYVRGYGQAIPMTVVKAKHQYISPAFTGEILEERTYRWCQQLIAENPDWRLSIQKHKLSNLR